MLNVKSIDIVIAILFAVKYFNKNCNNSNSAVLTIPHNSCYTSLNEVNYSLLLQILSTSKFSFIMGCQLFKHQLPNLSCMRTENYTQCVGASNVNIS